MIVRFFVCKAASSLVNRGIRLHMRANDVIIDCMRSRCLSLLIDQVQVFLPMEPTLAPYRRPL